MADQKPLQPSDYLKTKVVTVKETGASIFINEKDFDPKVHEDPTQKKTETEGREVLD